MSSEIKTECNYDGDNDILFIYRADRTPKASIELDKDLVLDLDSNRNICAVEIFNATKTISELVKSRFSSAFFKNIKACKLTSHQVGNLEYFKIGILSIGKELIEIPLIVPTGSYRSPAVAYA